MPHSETKDADQSARASWFTTTHWSVVLAAGQSPSPKSREALEQLCRTYWSPLYAFIRRRGFNPHEAQDLTQGFFLHLHAPDKVLPVFLL
jgi:RNA polymerase sigma-70 factor (ECF subfamily)